MFDFNTWKTREYPCVLAPGKVGETQEQLEETMMALNTMNAQRHSIPFKEELVGLLTSLSDTADTIERWYKVQQMWTSLESVFTGGDLDLGQKWKQNGSCFRFRQIICSKFDYSW